MADSKGFASLSPRLLARKGAAKPAMRPQVQPLSDFQSNVAEQCDLGWNDMGEASEDHAHLAPVVPISGTQARSPAAPEVLLRRQKLARDMARSRRSAPAGGKRAAFTLRIDAERHFKLRLACAASNRSAQHLLTEALDRMLAEIPEVNLTAGNARKRR